MFQVGTHMPKLFDSVAKLRFEGDENTSDSDSRQVTANDIVDMDAKVAVGMRSKDGEYVAMSEPCDCGGQVYICCTCSSLML